LKNPINFVILQTKKDKLESFFKIVILFMFAVAEIVWASETDLQPIGKISNLTGIEFFRYKLSDTLNADSVITAEKSQKLFDSGPALTKKGSIYRGISAGSGNGVGMVSGFNMEISGDISENMSVSANISDDKLSVSDESSSEMLSEIENIHIEFRHPNFITRIGDYRINNVSGSFGGLDKKASGIFASGMKDEITAAGFLSAEGSSFGSSDFIMAEGITGPFVISDGLNSKLSVVKNSESIYLNGIKLIRGEDYYFDYDNSYFSLKNTVSFRKGDRLTADYQYNSSDYKKASYGFGTSNEILSGRLKIKTDFFLDESRKNSPLSFDMNNETEEMMAQTSEGHIWVSGAVVSDGGEYELMPDSVHYEYVGRGNGSYDVRFSYAGSPGEYVRAFDSIGSVYYIYDPVNGDHLPVIKRKAPDRYTRLHGLAAFSEDVFKAECEFAASAYNANTFSSDRIFFNGSGNRQKLSFNTPGSYYGNGDLSVERIYRNSSLILPVRMEKLKKAEEINTAGSYGSGEYESYEGRLLFGIGKYSQNSLSVIYSETGSILKETGKEFSTFGNIGSYGYRGSVHLFEAETDSLIKTRNTLYLNAGRYRPEWDIAPYYRFSEEITGSSTAETRSDDHRFGTVLNSGTGEKVKVTVKSEYAVLSGSGGLTGDGQLKRYENAVIVKGRSGTVFNSEAYWKKIISDYTYRDSTDTNYDLAGFKANYVNGRIFGNYAEYETEFSRYEPKLRTYYKVEQGTGTHSLSGGEFYPDEFGDYRYYTSYTGKTTGADGVRFEMRTYIDPEEISARENILFWLSRFDLSHDLKIREKSRPADREDLIFLNIFKFQNDSTISGMIESVSTIGFMKKERNSLLYIFSYNKSLDRQYINYFERTVWKGHELTYKNRTGLFNHRITGKTSEFVRNENYAAVTAGRVLKRSLLYEFSEYFKSGSFYSIGSEYGTENETVREVSSESFGLLPQISFRFSEKGIARASGNITRVVSQNSLPYYMNGGMGIGWNYRWSMNGDYNFSKDLNGSLIYSGKMFSYDKKPFHEMRLEFVMNL
jgi:hypothetical protein